MKILLVHNKYCLPGGEDSVFSTETDLLKDLGYDVVTYEKSNKEFDGLSRLAKLKFLFTDFWYSKKVYKEIDLLCKQAKPQVAHFHNTFFMISPAAYKACKDNNVRVVKTLHNYRLICPNALLYSQGQACEKCLDGNFLHALKGKCWRNSFAQTLLSVMFLLYARFFKVYSKYVDRFIALSEFSKSRFANSGCIKKKIFVKPNYVETKACLRDKLEDYVLYVGALSEYKGVMDVIYAAQKCREQKFKIVGKGPLEDQIKDIINSEKITNIELLGQIENTEVLNKIRAAKYVMVPSKCYENFPRVLVEAYACAVPVLAPASPVFKELLCDEVNWSYEDRDDMVNKINGLKDRDDYIIKHGQDLLTLFNSKYTKENQRLFFEEIYSFDNS